METKPLSEVEALWLDRVKKDMADRDINTLSLGI